MAPIVAPEVVRYSIVGDYAGQMVVNILDVDLADGIGAVRQDDIDDCARDILNNWSDHILPLLQPEYVAREVRWVDLDSLSGSVGSLSETPDNTWPEAGGSSGFAMPGSVAVRVKKVTNGGRGTRSGRMFLAGVSEGWTVEGDSPNVLEPGAIDTINQALEDFKDGVQDISEGITRNICVVHTVNDVYVNHTFVSSFQVQPTLGTMRRRMPGYGR